MKRRVYQTASDIELLQTFNARQSAQTDGCGYIHTGDIFYHIFSGNKEFAPSDILTIWEDTQGVAAWMLSAPRRREFDAQVRVDLRETGFEKEVLVYAEERTLELMQMYRVEGSPLGCDAHHCDTIRQKHLVSLGWQLEIEAEYVYNRRSLADLPLLNTPDGYHIRPARGIEEAAALAEVHNASFGSNWTAERYLRMMQAPGYHHQLEYVAEASDGTFAGFTLTWHDAINKSGLLEPVGVHHAHRRKGLGRALVTYAIHQMRESGMTHAIVMNETANQAALNLYRACGFQPWHPLDTYTKKCESK